MRLLLISVTSAALLSGCATMNGVGESLSGLKPAPTEVVMDLPEPPQADWVGFAPDELPDTNWIGSFNDPRLDALVAEALAANANIGAAEAAWRASVSQARASRASLLPTLTGSVDTSHSEPVTDRAGDSNSLSYGLGASWEADLWGRVRDGVNSAELAADASQADLAAARLSVAGRVTQAWFNLIEARQLTELSEKDVATQERALRLTTRRFEGGVTGSSDVRLARSSLAGSQAGLASRKNALASAARSLEVLLRRYPGDSMEAATELPTLPALSGAAAPDYVISRRPDLLAADIRLQAAGLDVDAARKALLPSLNLTGSFGGGGSSLNNFLSLDRLAGRIAAGLSQPLFNGGRLKANVETRKAILEQQAQNYAGTALNAWLEVENALTSEQRLAEQEAALRVSLDEARKAEERLEARYSEGLATILQLLDAQSRSISAESQLISARKERLANRVRLHIALGGGAETQDVLLASRG